MLSGVRVELSVRTKRAPMNDAEFDAALAEAIDQIFTGSTVKTA
jgi:hypothetical protein